MAGLNFCCGEWMGDDKSANALFEILDDELPALVTPDEEEAYERDFHQPYFEACLDKEASELLLTPRMMLAILGPLRRYWDELVSRLGLSGPYPSPDEVRALPSDEYFRFKYVRDLLRGNEVCQQSGRAIKVYHA